MPGKVWTKVKIIAAIKRLHMQGADLSPTAVQIEHSALFSSARSHSHFGSWRAAVEAAGFNYDDFKRIKQRWTRDRIIEQICALYDEGEDLLDPEFKTRHRSLYLAACAHRYFGSWRRAVEGAGLNYEKMREARVWTKRRILRTIKRLAREGKPLGWAYIEEHEPGIYRAARRRENFGSWAGALSAAGVGETHPRLAIEAHSAPVMMMEGADDDEIVPAPDAPNAQDEPDEIADEQQASAPDSVTKF